MFIYFESGLWYDFFEKEFAKHFGHCLFIWTFQVMSLENSPMMREALMERHPEKLKWCF